MQNNKIIIYSLLFASIPFLILPQSSWAMAKRPPAPMPAPSEEVSIPIPRLTLGDCYYSALERSETVAISRQDIEEAEAQFYKASGDFLGDVDLQMTTFHQDAPKPITTDGGGGSSFGSTFNARERRERKFVIRQPLFQGFRSLGAMTGAGALRKQKVEEKRRTEQLLFQDVVTSFYTVLLHKKDLQIIQEIHDLLQKRIIDLEKREEIGRSRVSEVISARTGLERIEAEMARVQGELNASVHVLEFLTGKKLNAEALIEETFPDQETESVDLEESVVESETRPDVQAAQYAAKTAGRNLLIVQSDLWPQIDLESNIYDKREGFQRDYNWDLLFTVNVPLAKGGTTLGNIKEAVSKWKKAKFTYSRAQRTAALEVKRDYDLWVASVNQSKSLALAVKSSEENYKIQTDEYDRSLVSNLDVLSSLETLANSKREANRVHYETRQNYWKLQVAQGKVL